MGKVLAALLGMVGLGSQDAGHPEITSVDPRTLYFSMSTIANDMAPLEPVTQIADADPLIHEDEWRQIEFFPAGRLPEIRAILEELVRFEAANRHGDVFRNIFVRTLPDAPALAGGDAQQILAEQLGVPPGPGPVLFQGSDGATGRIANGFSFPLDGRVTLFGYRSERGVMVLSAVVGSGGNHEALTQAFIKLNRARGLIAVDWRSHMILVGVSPDGRIEAWTPG